MKLDLFPSDKYKTVVHMVSSDESADHNVSSDILQQKVNPKSDTTVSQEIHDTKTQSSKIKEEISIPSAVVKDEVKDSDATTTITCALQSDQEGSKCSIPLEKHFQSPDTPLRELLPLQSGYESPSIIREKVSKDGYNWRKYGQKHVKGNEFIRSYYRCTHPNCLAKKQLEQSNNGHIRDSICIGQHNHPRPQLKIALPDDSVPPPVVEEKPAKRPLANVEVEDKTSKEHGCVPKQIKPLNSLPNSSVSPTDEVKAEHLPLTRENDVVHNNEDPEPKRPKKDNITADATGVDKSACESRVVVQTSSEVDLVNDGYRWRKYGQKLVKGNTNPRSYYRCSNPGCPVKKHVERASHDSKIVITTYEGQHDHAIPPGRTFSHAVTNTHTVAINGKQGTKSGGNIVGTDTRERGCIDSESKSNEQLNGESITKSEAGDMVEYIEGPESKLNEKEQKNDNSSTKEDPVSNNITCHSNSEVPCRSSKKLKAEVKTKSDGSKDCRNVVVSDSLVPESELSKQSTCDAGPLQS